tara:strand:- start:254 stop:652 length:399 start_codon:yes stop_codon:yes gene_type:complete
MGPEAKLYQTVRRATPNIIYNRIENLSVQGMPDALCYNKRNQFFTVEFKMSKGDKVRLSPHQISWHFNHPINTFICIQTLGPRSKKLFHLVPGSMIMELAACSLALEDYSLTLEAIAEKFDNIGLTLETLGA